VIGGVVSQHFGNEAGFMMLAVAQAAMCGLHVRRLRAARSE
jgi:hypothetical protein